MEEKIWNVLQALDPSIGSFPTSRPNIMTTRSEKRRDVFKAVKELAEELNERYHPNTNLDPE